MAETRVILADGPSSGRVPVGAVDVPAARPESRPTEQLAGAFLFQNMGPNDDRLGRYVYATLIANCMFGI